jgi:predicted DNA-binding transcriptional regulator AlpA
VSHHKVPAEQIQKLSKVRYMRVPEILERTGVKSRVTIVNWQRAGLFPKFDRIGPNTVGLLESKFEEWQQSRDSV